MSDNPSVPVKEKPAPLQETPPDLPRPVPVPIKR